MKNADSTETQGIEPFLRAVLREINGRIESKTTLTYRQGDAQRAARMASRRAPGTLDSEILSDIAESNVPKFWNDYFASERERLGVLFREIAERGTLSKNDWVEQVENLSLGHPTLNVHMQGARPIIDPTPRFESTEPTATLDARIAYALITLATPNDAGLRVLQCKHCHDLFLASRGTTGRPRSEFCKYAHSNAYAQAQTRLRKRKREAAKHK
jgi:hypothetical protein